jgi:hypothetical protein
MQLMTVASIGKSAEATMPLNDYVEIKTDPVDELTKTSSVAWAMDQLISSLNAKGMGTKGNGKAAATIVIASLNNALTSGFTLPAERKPEMIALIPDLDRKNRILVSGIDARGLIYSLLELTDRVQSGGEDPVVALRLNAPIVETTPNRVRSVARAFCSEIEDKSWFYDRDFWTHYLDSLAFARFNRFNFTLGIGYDFPTGVTGDYLHFPYPYLVMLTAYPDVRVYPPLPPGEREKNLEMLQFIAVETDRRGLDFQLAIWTHAYEWTASPNSDHHILGLTPATHASYCRDALAELLKLCPQIKGITLRVHGESGIPEGSYGFWETLFEAFRSAGRRIEIDMHAKGLDQRMVDIAHKTGMRLTAGAKFWAEHLGIGYHQADIRATEYPRENVTGTFAVSNGTRNFTRYGYADFYQEGNGLELLYRVWPGTQHHLLWGDAALASGYGRAANFCGAAGMELLEPLTFKGREGSGHPDGRNAYAGRQLGSPKLDTGKFALTYFLWGRHLYNPETAPADYRRYLERTFGDATEHLDIALANSSRILPLVTTAWLPSASNHSLWIEMYTPTSILPVKGKPLYTDSPAPHNVSAVSPLDPQLFVSIDNYAQTLIRNVITPHYHPLEVAQWIDEMVAQSVSALAKAKKSASGRMSSPAFRRAEEDILILNGLGRYFASLFRAALCYSLFQSTGDKQVATKGLEYYRSALDSWGNMSTLAKSIYISDVSYGSTPNRRGHWLDRIPEIEKDVAAVEQYFANTNIAKTGVNASALLAAPYRRASFTVSHTPAQAFHPGSALSLRLQAAEPVTDAVLWYRHVTQAERWLSKPMEHSGQEFSATIPGTYTQSPFPLQYYFELRSQTEATFYPALSITLSNQPYFAVHRRT